MFCLSRDDYLYCRGTLKHSTVITMMKSMEPPVGWGRLCPQITAYKVCFEDLLYINVDELFYLLENDEAQYSTLGG